MVRLVSSPAAPHDLSDLVITTPCSMDWNRMDGDARTRYCSQCEKYVFNIAAMTRSEAMQLIGIGDRKVCARIFRRPDGTIVTSECAPPVPVAKRRRLQFSIGALVTLVTSSAALFAMTPWIGKHIRPYLQSWSATPQNTPNMLCTMGDVALAPPSPPVAAPR